jgi:hypothetical protein
MLSHVLGATLFGLVIVLCGLLSCWLVKEVGMSSVSLPDECKKWNDKYVLEKTLFITGVLAYLVGNATGMLKVNTRC